jgi:uroporphyrinogen-III synthase
MALRARGHQPIVAPLSEVELLAKVDLKAGPWAAIVLTSATALSGIVSFAAGKECLDVPIFAVGDATAKAARAKGFTEVASAGGRVNDLINLVVARLQPPARVLYLAGEQRSGDLAGALRAKNFEVDLVVVYRFLNARVLPEPAAAALNSELDGVLHFSRAAAEAFVNAAGNSNLLDVALTKPAHFCISDQVAAPLRQAGAARIEVAARPDQDALLELCR